MLKLSRHCFVALLLTLTLALNGFAADTPRKLANVTLDPPPGRGLSKIPLSQFKGKLLVIAIISTSCEACMSTVQILTRVQKDYGARGIQVVAAAVDQAALNGVGMVIDRFKPNFPIGLLSQDDTRYLADFNESDRPYVPILMFVDKGGTVQQQFFANSPFFQQQETAIRAMLNSMLPPK